MMLFCISPVLAVQTGEVGAVLSLGCGSQPPRGEHPGIPTPASCANLVWSQAPIFSLCSLINITFLLQCWLSFILSSLFCATALAISLLYYRGGEAAPQQRRAGLLGCRAVI